MFIAKLDHSLSLALFRLTRERSIHTVAVVFARWVFWMLLLGIGFFVYAHQEPLYVAELVKMMTLAIAFGFIGNLWFGKIIVRKRPFITHKLHPLIPTHWLGASFPSDHAMLSFAIATPLSVVDPVIGVWALSVAGLIALSRVSVGVHYLSDVVVGSAVGVIATLLAVFFVLF
ncbi:MAG: phosphatase PAP2 family protein [Patescibacteria group bacterium]